MAGNSDVPVVFRVVVVEKFKETPIRALGGEVLLAEEASFFKVEVDAQGMAEEEECGDPNHGVDLAPLHFELPFLSIWHCG